MRSSVLALFGLAQFAHVSVNRTRPDKYANGKRKAVTAAENPAYQTGLIQDAGKGIQGRCNARGYGRGNSYRPGQEKNWNRAGCCAA